MISFDKIPALIEESGLNCFKVTDMKGNKIVEFKGEDNTVEDVVAKLQDLEPILADQGRFKVYADHWNSCKSNWTGSHQWTVEMPNYESPSSSMGNRYNMGMGNSMQMMTLMMQNQKDLMGLNLNKQKMEFDYMRELDGLRGEIADTERSIIPPKYDKWVDLLIMRQANIKPEELVALGQMYGKDGEGAPAMAGGDIPVYANVATEGNHVDGQGYSTDQATQIEDLLNEIQHKVPFDKLYKLLEAVKEKPVIVDTALMFLKSN